MVLIENKIDANDILQKQGVDVLRAILKTFSTTLSRSLMPLKLNWQKKMKLD